MKLIASVLSALLLISAAQAGTEMSVSTGKDAKSAKELLSPYHFNANELQLDIFGAYSDGTGQSHSGPLQDHGFGGGLGVNYFFTRFLGVGADGFVLYGRENRQADDRGNQLDRAKHTAVYGTSGSLIFRLPLERMKAAPYLYVGGGYYSQSDDWASAHIGYGTDYRLFSDKVSLFMDTRFTYFGGRYSHGDQNSTMTKLGIRIIF